VNRIREAQEEMNRTSAIESSDPRATHEDPFTKAMLPVLMHRLNNATQLLQGWTALASLPGGASLAAERCSDLAEASRTIDETGWLLGVLASASGQELLLARRERRGLEPLLAAVHEAARRSDRELAPHEGSLPDLRPESGDGWQAPWMIGAWLFANALALPEKSRLEWELRRCTNADEVACRAPDRPSRRELESALALRVPGCRFRRTAEEHVLLLPAGSLVWGAWGR
jgi:hypothetical protein